MNRTADPWRDLTVIDARAPRFNQAVVATLSVVAVLTGAWPLLLVLGLQLGVSVVFGRRYCLPCLFYFEVVQPRVGEGMLEDSRAPRFANILGALFLTTGGLAWGLGFATLGLGLGVMVAALATLAVTTGLCVGCEVYRFAARLRGLRSRLIERIDLEQLHVSGLGEFVVEFIHPLCTDCHHLEARLRSEGRQVVTVDVSRRKDLARKYGVSLVPLAYAVRNDGLVLGRVS